MSPERSPILTASLTLHRIFRSALDGILLFLGTGSAVRILPALLLMAAIVIIPAGSEAAGRPRGGSDVTKISAGSNHTMVIRSDGTLWGWGINNMNQLGDGMDINRGDPDQITTDTDWVSVAAGNSHTVAIKSDGSLWAWGYNYYGQGGNGTQSSIESAVKITNAGTGWVSVAAGLYHTVGVKADGTLWAWGRNDVGQLGIGSTDSSAHTTPVQIAGSGWVSVAAGPNQSFGIKSDGTLWAWGLNTYGQLGDGSTTQRTSPVPVGTDNKWQSIAAGGFTSNGYQHTVGLKTDGTLWSWGYNYNGQLGLGSSDSSSHATPVQIGVDNKWASIDAGQYHTVAVKTDGTLWAWGWNYYGQLGNSSNTQSNSPVQAGSETKWISVSAGNFFTLGVKSDGTVWAWGYNYYGQLGDGTAIDKNAPAKAFWKGSKWVTVAGGRDHTAGIKADGTLWAWGYNSDGQIGDRSYQLNKVLPSKVGDNRWVSLEAGSFHTLGIKSDGSLWGWGYNSNGQLGDGTSGNNKTAPISIAAGTTWKAVDAGMYHTVAVKSDGTLWSWGDNYYGQLGDTTNTDRTAPVNIAAGSTWKTAAAGFQNSVGVRADGTLWTWGNNDYGQLGDGSKTNRNIPTRVITDGFEANDLTGLPWSTSGNGVWSTTTQTTHSGIYSAVAPASITDSQAATLQVVQSCATGTVSFWYSVSSEASYDFLDFYVDGVRRSAHDANWSGTVSWRSFSYLVTAGTHTFEWRYSKDVSASVGSDTAWIDDIVIPTTTGNWTQVTAGVEHTLALKADGSLWAWGDNFAGQLGNGTTKDSVSPLSIAAGTTWVSVAAGMYHSLGVRSDGTLWGWGYNYEDSVGCGGACDNTILSPVQIGVDTDWVSVAAGDFHSMATKSDGSVWIWGRNDSGQIGDWTTVGKDVPTQTDPDRNWSSIKAGSAHTVAAKSDGTLWSWGYNNQGQLGDGTSTNRKTPVQIGTDASWASVAAGYQHSLGILMTDGSLWAWGYNNNGQLGDGTPFSRTRPVQIGTDAWTSVAGGYYHSIGITSDGSLLAWGDNYYGQLGDLTTTDKNLPTLIASGTTWASAAAGSYHTVGVRSDGTLWAWGRNDYGQLGTTGSFDSSSHPTPAQVGNDGTWAAIAAGTSHTIGIKADGTLWAWGLNTSGQLGDNSNISKYTPTQIGTDNKWVTVAAGNLHTIAVKSDGTLWAWGANTTYQLGDGTNINKSTPTKVGTDTDWSEVFTAYDHTIAVKKNGTLYAWGSNGSYRLGDGTTTTRTTPKRINASITVAKTGYGSGTIDTAPSGMTCNGNLCSGTYEYGTVVDITATADGNSSFGSWSGCTSEADNVCTVNITLSTTAISASFDDTALPTGAISIAADYTSGPTKFAKSATLNLTLSAGDAGGSTHGVSYMCFSENGSDCSSSQIPFSTTTQYTLQNTAQGVHTVYVKFMDYAGNWSTIYSDTIVLDTALPSGSLTVNNGTLYTLSTSVTLTVSCGDGSGSGCTEMKFSNDGTVWSTPVAYSTSANWTLSSGDGTKTVSAVFKDNTGNWTDSLQAAKDTIILDTTPPTSSSTIEIDSGAQYANTPFVSLGLSCDDGAGSGCTPGQMQFSSDNTRWTVPQTTASSRSYSLNAGAGSLLAWGDNRSGQLGDTTTVGKSAPIALGMNEDFETGNLSTFPWSATGDGVWAVTSTAAHGGVYAAVAPASLVDGQSANLAVVRDCPEGTISFWYGVSSEQNYDYLKFYIDGVLQDAGWSGTVAWTQASYAVAAGTHTFTWVYSKDGSASVGDDTAWIDDIVISSGSTQWVAVAVGSNHAAGINADHTLWTWGKNDAGQLATGGTDGLAHSTPIQLKTAGATESDDFETGNLNKLPWTASGDGVWANTAAAAHGGTRAAEAPAGISDGQSATLELTRDCSDGLISFWYSVSSETNFDYLQFYIDGVMQERWSGTVAWTQASYAVAAGSHTFTWVYSKDGSVSTGSDTAWIDDVVLPAAAPTWRAVAVGLTHTVAIKTNGTLWAWGNNDNGMLGDNTTTPQYNPVQEYSKAANWAVVAAGYSHTVAIRKDGSLWAWGANNYGQLGDGTTTPRLAPVRIGSDTNWTWVSASYYQTVALRSDGTLWSWGRNNYGQLGIGSSDTAAHPSPAQVGAGTNWASVDAGPYHTVATRSDGTLWAWGNNPYGEVGIDTAVSVQTSPVQVGAGTAWASAAAGDYHTVATKTDGTAWAWGYNGYGQLGIGTSDSAAHVTPVQIGADNHWASIHAGGHTTSGKQLADGTKTVYVRFRDVIGNWSSAYSDTIVLDHTVPAGSVSINNAAVYTQASPVTLTIACTDATSGCSRMQVSNDNGSTWFTEEDYATSRSLPLISAGTQTVAVKFKDAAGTWSAPYADAIIYDSAGPAGLSVSINSGSTHANDPEVTLTLGASDPNGVSQMQFSNNGSIWSPLVPFASSTTWNLTDPGYGGTSSNGVKTVHVKFQDPAGNLSADATDSITYDTTPPTGSIAFHNLTTYTTGTTVQVDLVCSDAGSGCSQMRFSNDGINWSNAVAFAGSASWDITNASYGGSAADGAKTVYAQYKDTTGNWSNAVIATSIILDTTIPVGTIQINSLATYATGTNVTLSLACSDANGCSTMQFKNDSGSYSAPEPYAATKAWSLAGAQGLRTVTVQYRDSAGKTSTASSTITLDTIAPDPGGVTISGAPNTNESTVILNLNATGALQMQFSNNGSTWSPLVGYGTTFSWSLSDPTYGGTAVNEIKTVYAKFTDAAGNESSPVSGTITYDTAPPTGSLTFHDLTVFATSTSVQLDLICSDTGSGCSQMRFSNDGTTWSDAVAVSSSAVWNITDATYGGAAGDGSKTVYAQYKDTAGTWSNAVINRSIILDTTLPAGTIKINDQAAYATGTNVTLALTCNDVNACATMEFNNEGLGFSAPEAVSGSKTWSLLSADGTRTVNVRYTDSAGLQSTVTGTIILDSTGPTTTAAPAGKTSGSAVGVTLTCSDGSGIGCTSTYYTLDGSTPTASSTLYSGGTITVSGNEGTMYLKYFSVDGLGNQESPKTEEYEFLSGYTSLTLDLESPTLLQNGQLSASGKLTRYPNTEATPNNGMDLSGLTVALAITGPAGSSCESGCVAHTTTYSSLGHYEFQDLEYFEYKGTYTFTASFGGSGLHASSESSTEAMMVGSSAGYAIVVEGKISTEEGLSSHNKTANRVYDTLKDRGFVDDNIYYLNYNDAIPGVDAPTTKTAVEYAIETWAKERMNGSPAPLYIVMVDHGNQDTFYIDPETISATELDLWLKHLELGPNLDGVDGLNAQALLEKRVVIMGACYSGSFISALSSATTGTNGGRILITSAAADEQSYKGPNEPDNIRSGEYFLEEFFKELKKGGSLRAAFVEATAKTETFTSQGSGSANSNNAYQDTAVQHPLLDDDGDGTGSNALSDGSGDGVEADSLYLGVGVTNASLTPADLESVTPTVYLDENTSQATLWSEAYSNAAVSTAWFEVKAPAETLTGTGSTGQLDLDIPRKLMTLNGSTGRWEGVYGSDPLSSETFTTSGKYDVYYFTKSTDAEISQMQHSVVYKDKAGNNAPNTFDLVSPADASEQKTALVLEWQSTTDPDQDDTVTYAVEIATDSGFTEVAYAVEDLAVSWHFVDLDASLSDLTTYYWRVTAVDQYGKRQTSASRSFNTNNTNLTLPALVSGLVTDKVSGAALSGASVAFSAGGTKTTDATGRYVLSLSGGAALTATASKSGYVTSSSSSITAVSGSEKTLSFQLDPVQYTLTVSTDGTGEGTVASAPSGISGAGSKPFNSGTSVTLTATASAGSVFAGWSGSCTGTGTCTVTLDAARSVTATFTVTSYTVSTSAGSDGSIVPSSRLISSGTTTTFTVTPSSGYHIGTVTGCGGSLIGTTYTTGAVTGDCTITASFTNDAPTVPSLASPAGGSEVTTQTPVLEASSTDADGDSINYLYEVSAASNFDPVLTSSSGVSGSWTVDVTLSDNTTYWWRARATDGTAISADMSPAGFFVNTANDAPGQPQVSSPANSSQVSTLTPALTLTNATDIDNDVLNYEFHLSLSSNYTTTVQSANGIAAGEGTTSWSPAALTENALYYWRSRAADSHGAAGEWVTGSFLVNTANEAPGTPVLAAPASSAETTDQTPLLSVNQAVDPENDPVTYVFELDTVNTFDSGNKQSADTASTSWTSAALADNTTWYWRVKTSDGTADSSWMATASFFVNTANDAPSAPTVNYPADGSTVTVRTPQLSVNAAADADNDALTYEYEMYTGGDLSGLVAVADGIGANWQTSAVLSDNTWYYWRARARDGDDAASEWTALNSFFVNNNDTNDAPSITVLSPGASDGVAFGTSHTIQWTDSDPDSDAMITLGYDTIGSGCTGTTIAGSISENDAANSQAFDISSLAYGTSYWVYAVIDDGTTPVCAYAASALVRVDPSTLALTVMKAGTGSGTVTANDAEKISCGTDCSEVYDPDTVVTLTAAAGTGSSFTGWSGACSGTGSCQVTMSAARNVTATFALNSYTVTVVTDVNGGLDAGTPSPATVEHNGTANFTFNASAGYHVSSIADTCAGAGYSAGMNTPAAQSYTTGQVTADCTVFASFAPNKHALAVTKSGSGTVTSSPAGINCGSTCLGMYAHETVVTLTATPGADHLFDSWSGDADCSDGSVTMSDGQVCTAVFTPIQHLVSLSTGSNGSISPSSAVLVNQGANTVFTVSANSGYQIDSVTGCGGTLIGTQYTTDLIIGPCTVQATFKASDVGMFLVWQDKMYGNNNEVYGRRSDDQVATWQPMNRFSINTMESTKPRVAVSGSNAYVVWQDTMYASNNEIYYRRSINGGASFEPLSRLSVNSMESTNPDIAADANNVYVVWQDTMYGSNNEIYFRRSMNGGASFEPLMRLTINTMESTRPRVAVSGSNVYVVWQDTMYGSNNEIYLRRSTNGGESFGPMLRLTVNSMESTNPDIAAVGSNVYVVWQDTMYGNNNEIYVRRSADGGASFETASRITVNAMESTKPRVAASGNNVYIVWQDTMYENNNEIYFRRSTNAGSSFEPLARRTFNSMESTNPDIAADGDNVYIVWQDTMYGGNNEIYSRRSIDGGASFEPLSSLTVNVAESINPALP